MAKTKYYSVYSSNGNTYDDISFYKDQENGMIHIQLEDSELDFTVKECKEIIDKLKQCIKD